MPRKANTTAHPQVVGRFSWFVHGLRPRPFGPAARGARGPERTAQKSRYPPLAQERGSHPPGGEGATRPRYLRRAPDHQQGSSARLNARPSSADGGAVIPRQSRDPRRDRAGNKCGLRGPEREWPTEDRKGIRAELAAGPAGAGARRGGQWRATSAPKGRLRAGTGCRGRGRHLGILAKATLSKPSKSQRERASPSPWQRFLSASRSGRDPWGLRTGMPIPRGPWRISTGEKAHPHGPRR